MSQKKPMKPFRNRPLVTGSGDPGPPGADGAKWHSVTSTPAGSLGVVGDWALHQTSGQTWEKTGATTWTARGVLKGPQGEQGIQGETGATGATGDPGAQGPRGFDGASMLGGSSDPGSFIPDVEGSMYLNTTTGDVFFWTGSLWVPYGNIRGPQGPKGDKGDTGDKGDKGDTGDTGTAATVSVSSTTTGAPGTNASVTQGGTPQARTLAFTIPRGDKGEKGDPGGAGVLGGAKAWQTTAQSIPNATWTAITRTASPVSASIMVIDTVILPLSSPLQLLARVNSAGWWMVGASLSYAGHATGRRLMAVETWTGTDPGVGSGEVIIRAESAPGSSAFVALNGTTVVNLAANTNVRLIAYHTAGTSLSTSLNAPTELWLTRIL